MTRLVLAGVVLLPVSAQGGARADASGDLGGRKADDIDRVIKSRAGIFRACYQKELTATPGIAGKIVMQLELAADGKVTAAAAGEDTLENNKVTACLRTSLLGLTFAAGGAGRVTYPFVFSPG